MAADTLDPDEIHRLQSMLVENKDAADCMPLDVVLSLAVRHRGARW